MKIAVLGAGMVGRAMAIDLSKKFEVSSFDLSEKSLEILNKKCKEVKTVQSDLSDYKNYSQLLAPFDYVITAVPGFMGYKTLEAVINAKKNVVDISFFPEDALQLDALAKLFLSVNVHVASRLVLIINRSTLQPATTTRLKFLMLKH